MDAKKCRIASIDENRQLSAVARLLNDEMKRWSQVLEIIIQELNIELTRQGKALSTLDCQQRSNLKTIVDLLSRLVEFRDKKMKNHSRNVAGIAHNIALAMNLSKEETDTIYCHSGLRRQDYDGNPD